MRKRKDDIIHFTFDIGLLLKAIEAFLEIAAGIALIFITPTVMKNMASFIEEYIINAPMAETLAKFVFSYSIDVQRFIVFYMLSHGIVKMVVIIMLWRQKLWAYPISVAMFSFFIVYQLYHYETIHSSILILLTVLDIIMIVLTILEYKRLKTEGKWT